MSEPTPETPALPLTDEQIFGCLAMMSVPTKDAMRAVIDHALKLLGITAIVPPTEDQMMIEILGYVTWYNDVAEGKGGPAKFKKWLDKHFPKFTTPMPANACKHDWCGHGTMSTNEVASKCKKCGAIKFEDMSAPSGPPAPSPVQVFQSNDRKCTWVIGRSARAESWGGDKFISFEDYDAAYFQPDQMRQGYCELLGAAAAWLAAHPAPTQAITGSVIGKIKTEIKQQGYRDNCTCQLCTGLGTILAILAEAPSDTHDGKTAASISDATTALSKQTKETLLQLHELINKVSEIERLKKCLTSIADPLLHEGKSAAEWRLCWEDSVGELSIKEAEIEEKDAEIAALKKERDKANEALKRAVDHPNADGTDAAHPAWWRGEHYGGAARRLLQIMNGEAWAGTFSDKDMQTAAIKAMELATTPKQGGDSQKSGAVKMAGVTASPKPLGATARELAKRLAEICCYMYQKYKLHEDEARLGKQLLAALAAEPATFEAVPPAPNLAAYPEWAQLVAVDKAWRTGHGFVPQGEFSKLILALDAKMKAGTKDVIWTIESLAKKLYEDADTGRAFAWETCSFKHTWLRDAENALKILEVPYRLAPPPSPTHRDLSAITMDLAATAFSSRPIEEITKRLLELKAEHAAAKAALAGKEVQP